MVDIVSAQKRSRIMAAIKSRDTGPEIIIRKALHRRGYRYRLCDKSLPGTPDLVLPKYHAVILIEGCFWHKHDCHLFKWPKTRVDFWKNKIEGNAARDHHNQALLQNRGWRILRIWECALKGKHKLPLSEIITFSSSWLHSNNAYASVFGNESGSI